MKILNFIKSLIPSFTKNTVEEDIRLTRSEIVEVTQPAYENAVGLFKGWKFKSIDLNIQLTTFGRMVKSNGGGNVIITIEKGFENILKNLDIVEEMIKKSYNQEIAGQGLTYLNANLLQFTEAVAFVSKFSRKFLNYVYLCETAEYPDANITVKDSLTPAEILWIQSNFVSFCLAFNIVTDNPAHIKKQIDEIPDIMVTSDNADSLSSTIGDAKLDPFQLRLIPVWMNPIYHVGMFVAEWQAARYKASKEELRLLQLRKLNMEKLSEGKADAAVQKQIKYMESRIQDMNYSIDKMEKAHG